ncbi:MAG: hypothetical protein ACK5RG_19015 [Cyclobacteriaceae bacterium]|jgi:hypothetical protein|nr:hypothetical protein [Flammeovirgaceae bacterium]
MTKKLRNSIKKTPAINKDLPGYPLYPASEDIYQQNKEEQDIDPENINRNKTANENPESKNEKDFKEDPMGGDLDVPGSELDDAQEKVGSEDEENNLYSLGDDNSNELEEDKGD